MATKHDGGGGKALVAGPLKKIPLFFCGIPSQFWAQQYLEQMYPVAGTDPVISRWKILEQYQEKIIQNKTCVCENDSMLGRIFIRIPFVLPFESFWNPDPDHGQSWNQIQIQPSKI